MLPISAGRQAEADGAGRPGAAPAAGARTTCAARACCSAGSPWRASLQPAAHRRRQAQRQRLSARATQRPGGRAASRPAAARSASQVGGSGQCSGCRVQSRCVSTCTTGGSRLAAPGQPARQRCSAGGVVLRQAPQPGPHAGCGRCTSHTRRPSAATAAAMGAGAALELARLHRIGLGPPSARATHSAASGQASQAACARVHTVAPRSIRPWV
jgi:hypothetical protein